MRRRLANMRAFSVIPTHYSSHSGILPRLSAFRGSLRLNPTHDCQAFTYNYAMYPNFDTLEQLRQHHPAWRLLSSPHAPLIASFLHRVFIVPNERILSQADLAEALEDDLFVLRECLGSNAFPKTALEYLNDWAGKVSIEDTHYLR